MAGKINGGNREDQEFSEVRHKPKKMEEGKLYFVPSDQERGLCIPAIVKKVSVTGAKKVQITVEEYMPEIMQRMERRKNRNWKFQPRTWDIKKKQMKKTFLKINTENVSLNHYHPPLPFPPVY